MNWILYILLNIQLSWVAPKYEMEFSAILGDKFQYGYIFNYTGDLYPWKSVITDRLHYIYIKYNYKNSYIRYQVGIGDYFDEEIAIGYNYKYFFIDLGYSRSDKFIGEIGVVINF